jgi:hypothetical protein
VTLDLLALGGLQRTLHWGVLQISWANAAVILLMIAVFVAAVLLPFPRGSAGTPPRRERRNWTATARTRASASLPPDRLMPDEQPVYVASWIYVFGMLTVAALAVVLFSGAWLALAGPTWWHTGGLARFVNSMHLWGVELFFAFMVIHLWGQFFMAAWRGRRALTWMTGVLAFLASIATAFTGYLVQTNFDSQWIATQAKDGINATGAGAWWNVLDVGQMLLWHAALLPAAISVIVGLHLLLVRLRGVVPPIDADTDRTARPTEVGGRL